MSDELKPCPFCGTTEMLRRVGAQPGEGWSFVRCDYCDAEGPDPDNLPGHWNTRKSPDDDWTRWKMGESIDALAKERGCTRERMRLRLTRLDEGRTVIALETQVRELQRQLDSAKETLRLIDAECQERDKDELGDMARLALMDMRGDL